MTDYLHLSLDKDSVHLFRYWLETYPREVERKMKDKPKVTKERLDWAENAMRYLRAMRPEWFEEAK